MQSELQDDAPRIERGSIVVFDAIFDTGGKYLNYISEHFLMRSEEWVTIPQLPDYESDAGCVRHQGVP
jgi:hypothetical protein